MTVKNSYKVGKVSVFREEKDKQSRDGRSRDGRSRDGRAAMAAQAEKLSWVAVLRHECDSVLDAHA